MIDQLEQLVSVRGTRNETAGCGPDGLPTPPSSGLGWSTETHEIAPLLARQRLAQCGSFTVFWATAAQAPRLLDRISHEREIAFRAVGEGTGRERDRDLFDDRYLHLCAWDHVQNALAGAYRVGLLHAGMGDGEAGYGNGDGAVNGDDGPRPAGMPALDMLYTSTLFRFDRRLATLLSPGMELGRAFVRAPYQKHHAALMALWTGIGRLALGRPLTRYLFGAVSIGATYSPAASALMVAWLRRHAMHQRFASLTMPRTPIPAIGLGFGARGGSASARASAFVSPSSSKRASSLPPSYPLELSGEAVRAAAVHLHALPDIDALDSQVRALDREGKGVPVLLRQYLRLGARAVAFNVDPAFSNALDVLVVVDLRRAPAALLRRYMGNEGARAYLTRHENDDVVRDGRRRHERAA